MKIYNFEDFKKLIKKSKQSKKDLIDFENGKMVIHRCNLDKYLEKYACKDYDDLSNTMWYSFGCFVKIID